MCSSDLNSIFGRPGEARLTATASFDEIDAERQCEGALGSIDDRGVGAHFIDTPRFTTFVADLLAVEIIL